jgi:HEAT repeat protein
MNCTTARQAALLLLYGEISDAERAAAHDHVGGCDACRLALAEERRLLAILSERQGIEPDEDLLERCRQDLARALDERPAPGAEWAQRLLGFWSQARLTPAYGVLFLLVGFMAGAVAPRAGALQSVKPATQAAGPSATLSETPVASIRSLEASPDRDHVRLSYDTLQRGSLEGSASDPEIRALLLSTLETNQNPGLRLAAIEALRRHVGQEDVRRALVAALRADDNAGARLKAIEALDERVPSDPEIRRAMLDAVRQDANSGVRVRAIDLLSRASDPLLLPEMERLSREDPDTYVRMRSGDFVDAMYARSSQ